MLIKLKEHQGDDFGLSCWLDDIPNEPKHKYLGLHYDYWKGRKQLKASYFIGACWLEKSQLALQIQPKIEGVDYLKMFLKCFKHPEVGRGLSEIYQIDFNQPKIDLESSDFEITPLLIVHFLQVLKSIARKGLKKNYYPVQNNLNAKIKGKINISNTLKCNIFKAQNHKTVCDYQEFGINCMENRLLKNALLFVQSYLAKNPVKTDENLKHTLAYCLAPFELVSDEIDINSIKNLKNNAFFKEYGEALKLAKMILKHFAYNFKNTDNKQQTPPFYINMALLFEKYVYSLLLDNNKVKYHIIGSKKTEVDFLVDDIIVDTKYKPKYDTDCKIEDIRQLSGYGRDKKIREELNLDEEIAKCLIIYPNEKGQDLSDNLWGDAKEIEQFKNFKKIGVELPKII